EPSTAHLPAEGPIGCRARVSGTLDSPGSEYRVGSRHWQRCGRRTIRQRVVAVWVGFERIGLWLQVKVRNSRLDQRPSKHRLPTRIGQNGSAVVVVRLFMALTRAPGGAPATGYPR